MKVDKQTLQKIAHLARLEITPESEDKMLVDLNNMVNWVEKLQELDTEGVAPLQSMSMEVNNLREDEPKPHLSHERAMKNAPKKDSDYFRVPKVLE
jgi:aspartyl-tRNA(Asn)/glutamyl-tRNA(Gln) amidotransferase subunit C